jgi:hypothetical protein
LAGRGAQSEAGVYVADLRRNHGVSHATVDIYERHFRCKGVVDLLRI